MIRNRMGTMYDDQDNPFVLDRLDRLIQNVHFLRTGGANTPGMFARKDYNKECDYPETVSIQPQDYREMYDRNPIGTRVVSFMAKECWQISPQVYEDEDASIETEFEKAFNALGKFVLGEKSWYDDPQAGNPLWEYLYRADKISGIGQFGLILIGIDDGKSLDQPVEGFADPVNGRARANAPIFVNNLNGRRRNLIYLSIFDESALKNVEYDNNMFSPRYRKPKYYHVDLGDEMSTSYVTTGREGRSVKVHWSRCIHVADNLDGSDIFGVPRQRPVWNNLLNLMKIYGGDAEGWWRACIARVFIESYPQLGGDVDLDMDSLREQFWDMENGLQKMMALVGASAKTVAPSVADPLNHVNTQVEAICVQLDVPKRIFLGSERGQLSSGQDDATWNDRLRGRRNTYLTPRLIVPFVNRLIQMRVLPEPEGYRVEWPDPETMKPLEKADLAVKKVDALVKYISGQGDTLIDPLDFLTKFLDIEEEEAVGILERAAEFAPPPEEEPQMDVAEGQQEEVGTSIDVEEEEIPEQTVRNIERLLINVGFVSDAQRKAVMAKLGGKVVAMRGGGKSSGGEQGRGPGGKFAETSDKEDPTAERRRSADRGKVVVEPPVKISEFKVGVHVTKVGGDKKEAAQALDSLVEVDKTFGGNLSEFLEKNPIKSMTVGKVAGEPGSSGYFNHATGQLVLQPAKKNGFLLAKKDETIPTLVGHSKEDWEVGQAASRNAILLHEIGHHVAHTAIKKTKDGQREVYKKLIIDSFQAEGKKPSKYAETHPHEFFAEAFTAYHYAPDKLSPVAKSMVENVMSAAVKGG